MAQREGHSESAYEFFTIFILVFAFLLLPTRTALVRDVAGLLAGTATIQWALMICIYCVSYAPTFLALNIAGYKNENAKLLHFLVIVVQSSDVSSTPGASSSDAAASRPRSVPTNGFCTG